MTTLNYTIRIAELDDLRSMKELFKASVENCNAHYSQEQIRVWSASTTKQERWQNIIHEQVTWVAEHENELLGFASLRNEHLDLIYVHPAHQRKGIATHLFSRLQEHAISSGLKGLTAEVSLVALALFLKQGFVVQNEQRVIRAGIGLQNYGMMKVL